MQTDPVGYTADPNLYTYVGNDPTDETDPTGLACADPCPASALPKAKDEIAIAKAVATTVANHPGETMQVVGAGIAMIPTPQTEAAGETLEGAGTAVRALDGEGAAGAVPASTLKPGPNAGDSIPASGPKITPSEQQQVNKIGNESAAKGSCEIPRSHRRRLRFHANGVQPFTGEASTGARLY